MDSAQQEPPVFSGKMNSSPDIQSNCLGLWEYEGSWELQELQRQHFYIVWKLPVVVRNHRGQPKGEKRNSPGKSSPGKISIVTSEEFSIVLSSEDEETQSGYPMNRREEPGGL
ncbi:hypothetical protein R6Z07F_019510 [Ovis aries]